MTKDVTIWNMDSSVYDPNSKRKEVAFNDEVVKLTGNQTIDWIKTFSSSPIVPTPTTDMQVATKKYVDDNAWRWLTYSAISTSQTASVWVYYGVTCSNSNITLTIPNWTSAWDTIYVKKLDNTSYWVILSWNIEIDTSYTLGLQFESIDLYWNWTYYLIK